ncbi:carbohydrate ABC transporter ATP-binding protein, CUT1 family [Dendrosporobacter quercicolus]|uniref:Carbohydrate ABC transporter ATP-binding protein, CUT1 family n=2 Tax=Dendrosporobacter quercicolus TaxID=146817 RepID=A0A1G9RX68_9FIRM|nr:carbohydrate ABC transporter ATP-binding protein, CUT1 family [Dendrosporobacter quercicolus]
MMGMNKITFQHVCKAYGENTVVKNLNFTIDEGERLILLGPSGCGKTTILRMVAGFESITSGALLMGGQKVNQLEPGARNVAMVFQNYALYPHMTVWENITFGLSIQKVDKAEIKTRADQALSILNLSGYEQRKPHELSGGQKQRVALARAWVKQAPYFLLDEPLSNLDAQLRLQARTELVKIHRLYRPTMIYVTHDQVEAMTVGHRIAIMNQGSLQQLDSPGDIYQHPANTFVASFIGSPPMNLLPGQFREGALWFGDQRLCPPAGWKTLLARHPGLYLGIRPEQCYLSDAPLLPGQVEFKEHLGAQLCIHLRLTHNNQRVLCLLPADQPLPEGIKGISFSWRRISCFADETGLNIGYPDQINQTAPAKPA